MANNYQTPPLVSISPAVNQPRTPKKTRILSRLSTPNVPILMLSPKLSPIQSNSLMRPCYDSAKKNRPFKLSASPLEKSYRAPLDDHLDLKVVLKEFDLSHLLPVFESKGVTLEGLSDMTNKDFIDLGVFSLSELDRLRRVCNMLDDTQNTSS